jgi:hypothetical protein
MLCAAVFRQFLQIGVGITAVLLNRDNRFLKLPIETRSVGCLSPIRKPLTTLTIDLCVRCVAVLFCHGVSTDSTAMMITIALCR